MLNIFIQESAISALEKMELKKEGIPWRNAVVELISLPLRGIVTVTEGKLEVRVYLRDEKLTDSTLYRSGSFPWKIPAEISQEERVAALYAISYGKILAWLQQQGVLEAYSVMDETTEGILLSSSDTGLVALPVSGRNRPALKCQLQSGGIQLVKPYDVLPEDTEPTQHIPEVDRKLAEAFALLEEEEARAITALYDRVETVPDKKSSLLWELSYVDAVFDLKEDTAVIFDELVSSMDAPLCIGDPVKLVRRPGTEALVYVEDEAGKCLGSLSSQKGAVIASLMDGGFPEAITGVIYTVTPISEESTDRSVGIRIVLHFDSLTQCTVCKLAGDQVGMWSQELTVSHCTMPLQDAKALFELYNRFHREYDNLDRGIGDTSYAGLDNLEEEILTAREKMQSQRIPGRDYSAGETKGCNGFGGYVRYQILREPLRYGSLRQYEIPDYSRLDEILERYCLAEEKFYWLDQTRVSEETYAECEGFEHWYEVLELYEGRQLPVDLQDAEVVSIFGCGCFEAFADMSYGC